jgi:hypothetical protein
MRNFLTVDHCQIFMDNGMRSMAHRMWPLRSPSHLCGILKSMKAILAPGGSAANVEEAPPAQFLFWVFINDRADLMPILES